MKLIATLLIATFALAGCNTLEGIGKDVQKADLDSIPAEADEQSAA